MSEPTVATPTTQPLAAMIADANSRSLRAEALRNVLRFSIAGLGAGMGAGGALGLGRLAFGNTLGSGSVRSRTPAPVIAEMPVPAKDEEEPVRRLRKRAGDMPIRSDDLLSPDAGGFLADYLAGGNTWGGTRAGKATQMSRATGEEPGANLRYPMTADWLSAITGGSIGAGVGNLVGRATQGPGTPDTLAITTLGGALGAAPAVLLARFLRRRQLQSVSRKFDEAAAAGKLQNVKPNLSALRSILLPFGGAHRAGQADAYEAISAAKRGKRPQRQNTESRDIGYALQHLPYTSMPAALFMGAGQGLGAQERIRAADRASDAAESTKQAGESLIPSPRSAIAATANALGGSGATTLTGIPWYVPAAVGIPMAGSYAGWKLMDYVLDKRRGGRVDADVASAKAEYEQALRESQGIKKSSADDLGATLDKLYDVVCVKQAANWLTNMLGEAAGVYLLGAGGAAGISGYGAYQWAKKRRKRELLDKALKNIKYRQQLLQPAPILIQPVRTAVPTPADPPDMSDVSLGAIDM